MNFESSIVIQRPVDIPQPGDHELLHLRHPQPEEHYLRDRQLRLSSANHLDLRRDGYPLITSEIHRRSFSASGWRKMR